MCSRSLPGFAEAPSEAEGEAEGSRMVKKLPLKIPTALCRITSCRITMVCMISEDLLALLVCPVCKKPVVPSGNGQSLKCGECRRVYPIQDDIPIMLVDAATIDPT
jgi:uncharacterized protein YbaR (Trm112 family)